MNQVSFNLRPGPAFANESRSFRVLRDGRRIIGNWDNGEIVIWHVDSGLVEEVLTPEGESFEDVDDQHGLLVTLPVFGENRVRLRSLESGDLIREIQIEDESLYAARLTPDAETLLLGGFSGVIHRWECRAGRELSPLEGHTAPVWNLCVTPFEGMAVSGGMDGNVHVWDVNAGTLLGALCEDWNWISCLAISSGQQFLAATDFAGTLAVWKTSTWTKLGDFQGHDGVVTGLAVSSDSKLLASVGKDGCLRLWKLPSLELLTCYQHSGGLLNCEFFPNSWQLLIGNADGGTHLVTLQTETQNHIIV